MKTVSCLFLTSLVCTLSLSTLATASGGKDAMGVPYPAPISGKIYQALNVNAVNVTHGRLGAGVMRKSVGGLICEESTPVVPGPPRPHYNCALSVDAAYRDDQAIYQALNLPEVSGNPTNRVGTLYLKKGIENLTCSKQSVVAPNASIYYHCSVL